MSDVYRDDPLGLLDKRYDDVDDVESTMTPEEINAYLAEQIAGEQDEELVLDMDTVRALFEYACEQEFLDDDWKFISESESFDQFWSAMEVMIVHWARSEGLIY